MKTKLLTRKQHKFGKLPLSQQSGQKCKTSSCNLLKLFAISWPSKSSPCVRLHNCPLLLFWISLSQPTFYTKGSNPHCAHLFASKKCMAVKSHKNCKQHARVPGTKHHEYQWVSHARYHAGIKSSLAAVWLAGGHIVSLPAWHGHECVSRRINCIVDHLVYMLFAAHIMAPTVFQLASRAQEAQKGFTQYIQQT